MIDKELPQLTALVSERLRYFADLKKWLDGYIKVTETALADAAPIDRRRYDAAIHLRERITTLILDDGLMLAEYGYDDGVKEYIPRQFGVRLHD